MLRANTNIKLRNKANCEQSEHKTAKRSQLFVDHKGHSIVYITILLYTRIGPSGLLIHVKSTAIQVLAFAAARRPQYHIFFAAALRQRYIGERKRKDLSLRPVVVIVTGADLFQSFRPPSGVGTIQNDRSVALSHSSLRKWFGWRCLSELGHTAARMGGFLA